MSTKNLARTIIEGGRTRWSSWFRRHTLRVHRQTGRAVLRRLETAGDADDITFVRRKSACREFHDKLGPAKRWLDRQVGRPWNLVRSEMLQRFDTRTTPGRHIVFDHMLPWVEDDAFSLRWGEFEVDAHGLLRRLPHRRYRHVRRYEPLPQPEEKLERWLAGRRVGERGSALFWFTSTPGGAYRQHRRLADQDAEIWRSLPGWFRERHQPGAPPPSSNEL
jgi:hypothetical protein